MTSDIPKNPAEPSPSDPTQLMRARHPELFSDSEIARVNELPQVQFEYHLDTLTNRNEYVVFEYFARALAEKTICPNLRPQTGPTGGGDSKVDSETYPVAEEIAERWWIGGPEAGRERWAIAISTKKDWKTKVRSDVLNIAGTGRRYDKIVFITSQFAPDKSRSRSEDELTKQTGISVTIHDRSWIVKQVYENGFLELAIDKLGITGAQTSSKVRAGPRDSEREAELAELDRNVADPAHYGTAKYQLAEDCLRSAVLARGLERPRFEVEGRFDAARRIADDVGFPSQRLRVAYTHAWTAFWWFKDYATFDALYDVVEELARGTAEVTETNLVFNLWQLLSTAVFLGNMTNEDGKPAARGDKICMELERLAADVRRPNNALQAETTLCVMKITKCFRKGSLSSLDGLWTELKGIVIKAEAHGSYPIEHLQNMVFEMGNWAEGDAFEQLADQLISTISSRRSEGVAGEAYIKRGSQRLNQNKPYDAIRFFGRAEELLIKEEYQDELVRALVGGSYSYERVGLLWAARSKILAAAERCLRVFQTDGEFIRAALAALQRLVWLELQLGRIPQVLQAMHLAAIIAHHLKLSDTDLDEHREEVAMQEGVLGIHLLQVPVAELGHIERLPDKLEELGLEQARIAALFSLGQTSLLRREGEIPGELSEADFAGPFSLWRKQPASKDIAAIPIMMAGKSTTFSSTILGVDIFFRVPNDEAAVGLAETLLGALEALLSTSNEDDLLPRRDHFNITLKSAAGCERVPQIVFDGENDQATLLYDPKFDFADDRQMGEFAEWLRDCLFEISIRIFYVRELHEWMEKVCGDERAVSRAVSLGNALTLGRNIFGHTPKIFMADWAPDEATHYEATRATDWPEDNKKQTSERRFGEGPSPDGLFDRDTLKHSERRVMTPIDSEKWDRAKWRGTFFGDQGTASRPIMLGMIFEDIEAGKAIFSRWRERYGEEDEENNIRIAIVRGISRKNPHEYAVLVGPNMRFGETDRAKTFMTIQRINRMEPTTSANLDRFLGFYAEAGGYRLLPFMQPAPGEPAKVLFEKGIWKRHLEVRNAWEIGLNDPDSMAIKSGDDPLIPPGVVDAPVLAVLAQRKEQEN